MTGARRRAPCARRWTWNTGIEIFGIWLCMSAHTRRPGVPGTQSGDHWHARQPAAMSMSRRAHAIEAMQWASRMTCTTNGVRMI